MELYASGFNAWSQLHFKRIFEEEPQDFLDFQCVLEDEDIKVVKAGLSSTLLETSSGIHLAGMTDPLISHIHTHPESSHLLSEAGNGKIAAIHLLHNTKIQEYASWSNFPEYPANTWELGEEVKQVVSGDTFFAALGSKGTVWTWGDARYGSCLGRELSARSPKSAHRASQPQPIVDLESLPESRITKLASCGHLTAALTSSHDLYLWGVDIDDAMGLELTSSPNPLDLLGLDILDVGVGDRHIVVLTEDGRIWVRGEGRNGQLGLGRGITRVDEWRSVEIGFPDETRREAVGVIVAPKHSFVLIRVMEPRL